MSFISSRDEEENEGYKIEYRERNGTWFQIEYKKKYMPFYLI